ncbi:glycosyltransferase family 2 protein [Sphingobacterium sp. LRF_L2]|uniref:glycosyltransferase family 2 protein n=1 Tax=Sphingobacterium sp. LRF_L2 TaxID=3369421 RepID=UPI003F5D97D5
MLKKYPKVSIIIPVYNAVNTLPTCLDALRAQSYPVLEFIFINDCSTDASVQLLDAFAADYLEEGELDVKVLHHTKNQGVAVARNTGLNAATGDFLYYVDADDSLVPDTITLAVENAEKTEADIVGFNWFLTFDKNERKMNQPAFNTPWDALEKMMQGTMRWNLWLFLVRRSLYENNQIRFTPNMNMGEDLLVMVKLFGVAEKVAYIDEVLYRYRQSNSASLTKTYSIDHIQQVTANVKEVEAFLIDSPYATKLGNLIAYLKLNIKLPLLISDQTSQYKRWLNWFPEANAFTMENKSLPWRTRILQFAAVKKQFWLLKLYYYFVIRLVYGVIYR